MKRLPHAALGLLLVVVIPVAPNEHRIDIQATSTATPAKLWTVLTDYDHHAQYIPYMFSVKTLQRNGASLTLEQIGALKILFWTFTMRAVFDAKEKEPETIDFHAIDGDFEKLDGRWSITSSTTTLGASQLSVTFYCKPKARVPTWAVRIAAKHYLAHMVDAMTQKAEAL